MLIKLCVCMRRNQQLFALPRERTGIEKTWREPKRFLIAPQMRLEHDFDSH